METVYRPLLIGEDRPYFKCGCGFLHQMHTAPECSTPMTHEDRHTFTKEDGIHRFVFERWAGPYARLYYDELQRLRSERDG